MRDYYAADSAALIQQPAKPEMHDKATGAGTSIIGILEVCESDFATNLAKEEQEESDAQEEYEKLSQESACVVLSHHVLLACSVDSPLDESPA